MKCKGCGRGINPDFRFCSDDCESRFFSSINSGLRCFIDGNCLCIVGPDFIDQQKSNCVFIGINRQQDNDIRDLIKRPKERKA